MMKRLLLAFVAVVSLAAVAGPALAQTPGEIEANRLYKEAKADMEAMKFDVALPKLEKAYDLFPMPVILARVAECYEKTGDLDKAIELYKKLKAEPKLDPKLKGRVEKSIADIEFQLSSPVEITVAPNTTKVEVTVDHVDRYVAPCVVKLTRGRHHFEFRKEGYEIYREDKLVKGAAVQTYAVNLKEQVGKAVIVTDLRSMEGIILRVDDKDLVAVGSSSARNRTEPIALRSGSHSLLCAKDGMTPFVTTFSVMPGQVVEVACKLKSAGGGVSVGKIVWWSTAGAGAVMAGLGTWLTVSYFQDKKKAERDDLKFSSNKQYFGPVLLGLGAAAMGTATYFLVTGWGESKPKGTVQPAAFGVTAAPVKGGVVAGGYVSF